MKRKLLILGIVVTMVAALVAPVAVAADANVNMTAASGILGNTLNSAYSKDGTNLLQFTSDGHVLGFNQDGVIIASADHMLKTSFLNSNTAVPEAANAVSGEPGNGAALALGQVTYNNIWDGVTLVFAASEGAIMESSYYLNPINGAIPIKSIRLGYNRPVSLDENGNLVIAYANGTIMEAAPIAWQEINGQRQPVTAAYVLYGANEVGFSLGKYVPSVQVVIDPAMTWLKTLGGSGDSKGTGIVKDIYGTVFVVGNNITSGTTFVTKFDSSGDSGWNITLGNGDNYGNAIAVGNDGTTFPEHDNGNVYVAGSTAPQGSTTGSAFATDLNRDTGAFIWNTPLGSGGYQGNAISSDIEGETDSVYVAGNTGPSGSSQAFAAKLASDTGAITWTKILGSGGGNDYGNGIGANVESVFVVGTSSATWAATNPNLSEPIRAFSSNSDAFVAKLDSSNGNLLDNTFLGGNGADQGNAIALDDNYVYVVGNSNATWGNPKQAFSGSSDAFVAKLDQDYLDLTWNTFLGGSAVGTGITIGEDKNYNELIFVCGYSSATWGSPTLSFTASKDAFAAQLNTSGNIVWNTFVAGSTDTEGTGISANNYGEFAMVGYSSDPVAFAADLSVYTATPIITTPIYNTATSISGTALPAASIVLSINNASQPDVTANATTGAWTVPGLTLAIDDFISVTAQVPDAMVSAAATTTVVAVPSAPTVTNINPTSGTTAGGTTVTVTGSGFFGGGSSSAVSKVNFGTTAGTALNVTSDTSLSITSPTGSGPVDVTVVTPGGTSATSAADKFTYVAPVPAPTVTNINPTSGTTAGGTTVTVTGSGFFGGGSSSAVSKVNFGTTAGTGLNVTSDTSLSITSPTGSGPVDVTVVTPGGTSATSAADKFTYVAPVPAPTVTNINPTSGTTAGGTTVTVTGSGFFGGGSSSAVSKVNFGTTAGTGLNVTSDTSLSITSPTGSGPVDVTVVTPGGTSATSAADKFTYVAPVPAPTVTNINPTSGTTAGGTTVTVTGSGFFGGGSSSAVSKVNFGTTAGTALNVTSDTSLSITSPTGSGPVDVTVVTPGGTSATSAADKFTYVAPVPAPTVTNINPTSGTTAGGTTVTVTGSGFFGGGSSSAVSKVNFGTTAGTALNVTSDTSLSITSPTGSGPVDVTVVTPGGTSATSAADKFTYVAPVPAPTVTNINPTSGTTAGGTTVTVTGSGFFGGGSSSAVSKVNFGTTAGTGLNVTSDTSLSITSPAGSGPVDVTVVTPGGTSATSSADKFTYVAATIGKATKTFVGTFPNPSEYGKPVQFIAVVLPSLDTNTPKVTFNNGEPNLNAATQSLKTPREIPTGTVVFKDNGTPIGTGTLDKLGIATLTYSLLPVGNHNITAVYSGDSNFASSISNVIVQKILSKTTITWPTKPNPCKFGQICTFTLRIEVQSSGAGTLTGTVSFYDGFKSLGNCGVSDSGLASFSTDQLTIGSHNIIAVYSGDGNFNTCSGTFIQTITAK